MTSDDFLVRQLLVKHSAWPLELRPNESEDGLKPLRFLSIIPILAVVFATAPGASAQDRDAARKLDRKLRHRAADSKGGRSRVIRGGL